MSIARYFATLAYARATEIGGQKRHGDDQNCLEVIMGRRSTRMRLLGLLALTPASAWLSPPSRATHRPLQAVVPKVDLENVEEAFAYANEIREHAPSLFERLETARPEDALEMLTYAEQLQKATTYLRPSARQAVRYALEVAFLAHRGQTRRSGQPFVTHPVAVASILAETRMDRDAVVSGLLHDTVEDTPLTFGEIEAEFVRTEEHGIFKFEIIDLRPHRRVSSCYTNATYDRRITRRGCAYEWTPAMDMTAFRTTPNASACPVTRGATGSAPSDAFSFGWAGQRGACRCIATAPRTRCIHCEGMSPLTREIMSE